MSMPLNPGHLSSRGWAHGTAWHKSGTSGEIQDGWRPYTGCSSWRPTNSVKALNWIETNPPCVARSEAHRQRHARQRPLRRLAVVPRRHLVATSRTRPRQMQTRLVLGQLLRWPFSAHRYCTSATGQHALFCCYAPCCRGALSDAAFSRLSGPPASPSQGPNLQNILRLIARLS